MFIEEDLEESVKTVEEKARSDEEREEGRELLRQAFDNAGQPEGKELIGG